MKPFGSLSFNNTGYGSAGAGRKVQPNLLFRIASISKTITAVGIMRLVEERKLSLEDRVFGPQGKLMNFFGHLFGCFGNQELSAFKFMNVKRK